MSAREKPAGPAAVTRRRWAPPPPSNLSTLTIVGVIVLALMLAVGLVAGLHYVLVPASVPMKAVLADEFRDRVNELADFAFRPPRNWHIDDRTQKYTYYVQGPRESGFSPLMIFTGVTAPGTLAAFLDEHKKRIAIEEPSTRFISEDDDSIDGCRAKRIEYDCDYKEFDTSPPIKLRTLQFIVKDPSFPVFYKITCHALKETYDSHVPTFEASAHSFRRVEVKVPQRFGLPLPQ